uniref:BRISC and BRCA1-A complex member 2 n=1 Tax=Cucumis melo TaxID=3656 RepID=A0A9I9E931_CUCME
MSADTVPPLIAAHINYLLNHFPLPVKLLKFMVTVYSDLELDQFTEFIGNGWYWKLSTCGLAVDTTLELWIGDIMYNAESPFSAPDIMFGPEDENFHPFSSKVDEGEGDHNSLQNSLRDWNSKDPSRLTSLLQELRDRYVSYQRKRVEGVDDERLKFELCTMLSREGIEMHLSSGVEKVLYPVVRKYATTPSAPRLKLVSTSELKALLSIEDIKLPSWIDGMCMAEYLPHLEESLEKQVLEAVSLIDVRRGFIEALDNFFGRPLEADPVFCRTATVITASGVFTFLMKKWVLSLNWVIAKTFYIYLSSQMVHILISTQFPKKQPSLVLQSSQHFNSQGAPIKSQLITDYPWSPRWEPLQMAERIL